jgi:hypothetical protein
METNLRGVRVTRKEKAVFVPLPRELWTGGQGCDCGHCFGTGYWDTLAVAADGQGEWSDRTWMVHYPELQPASVREALRQEAEAK